MSPSKKPSNKKQTKATQRAQKIKKTSVRASRATVHQTPSTKSKRKLSQTKSRQPVAMALTPPVQVVHPQIVETPKPSNWQTNLLRVAALLIVVAITIYIFSIRDKVEEFKEYGYAGIFMVALLANATVLLPAPGVAIIYAMGSVFNPFGVGLAAGTGGALGELSGYLAGFSGQAVVERSDIYNRIKPWVEKYGGWAILVLSAIPNPVFDVAGIAAGIVKMPLRTFLLAVWVGQLIKMTLFALAGRTSIQAIENFMK